MRERRLDALVWTGSLVPDVRSKQGPGRVLEGCASRGFPPWPWTKSSRQLQERLCLSRHHLGDRLAGYRSGNNCLAGKRCLTGWPSRAAKQDAEA